jgi:SsrA-binding protein
MWYGKIVSIIMSTFIQNKKAHFDYETLEELEAGIELFGFEVKSVRAGQGSLEGARVIVRGAEAFIIGSSIPAHQPKNAPKNYEQDRTRKLLVSKKELAVIADAEHKKGLTIVPFSMYSKGRYIKVKVAIVRGKKKFDKRETLKERDTRREMDRALKSR